MIDLELIQNGYNVHTNTDWAKTFVICLHFHLFTKYSVVIDSWCVKIKWTKKNDLKHNNSCGERRCFTVVTIYYVLYLIAICTPKRQDLLHKSQKQIFKIFMQSINAFNVSESWQLTTIRQFICSVR